MQTFTKVLIGIGVGGLIYGISSAASAAPSPDGPVPNPTPGGDSNDTQDDVLPPVPDEVLPTGAIHPLVDGPCLPSLPLCGKGMFLESASGDPHGFRSFVENGQTVAGFDAFVTRLRFLGIRWVMMQAVLQYSNRRAPDVLYRRVQQEWVPLAARLRAEGIGVLGWGYPRADSAADIDTYVAIAQECAAHVDGWVLNPEAPFQSSRKPQAVELMDRLNAIYPRERIGVCTYGTANPLAAHPNFPWHEFMSRAGFMLPEMYTTTGRPDGFQASLVETWVDLFARPVVPVLAAYHTPNSGAPTAADMQRYYEGLVLPAGSVAWWNLRHVLNSPARAEVVRLAVANNRSTF